jgi:hypothetical protein
MKISSWKYGVIVLLLSCVAAGCKKEEQTSDYIYGVVRNSFTNEPIPFARVGVLMSVSDGLWNSTESIVDTFMTYADGGFKLDRNKYRALEDQGPCSFILCSAGPLLEQGDIFYDNCASGEYFNSYENERIYCDLWPKAWARVKVIDSPNLNYNLTQAIIQSPYSWEGVIGTYPENYDSHLGIVVNIPTADDSEIPVLLLMENEKGEQEALGYHIPVYGLGMDTVDVVVEY